VAESDFDGEATVILQTSSGDVLASASVPLSGSQTEWASANVTLTPSETLNTTDNVFAITFDGAAAAGESINFALLSLFPPTFKDRENGMRIDIAEVRIISRVSCTFCTDHLSQALLGMSPSFFRFPGGNNLVSVSQAPTYQVNIQTDVLNRR